MIDFQAIILAAGIGKRLGDSRNDRPKCLLDFGGISLLRRHLDTLNYYQVRQITIVTGHKANLIRQEINASSEIQSVNLTFNPDYRDGSIISLQQGITAADPDTDIILMDADVLYDHRIMAKLLQSNNSNCFLLDRSFETGDEPVKLCVRNGRLIEFRKKIDTDLLFDFQGESVGFFRFTWETAKKLLTCTRSYTDQGDRNQPYEECIRDLLLAHPEHFSYEDISGIPWIEIDFPEDIERAKKEILGKLTPLNA